MHPLFAQLGIRLPIVQAPMAGTSTPAMAAAVSNAGGLGSVALGATSAAAAGPVLEAVRAGTQRAFNVNLFCHAPAQPDHALEAAWLERLRPQFTAFGAEPPSGLTEIYRSFVKDDDMLRLLLQVRPAVVSFHFGLPSADRIAALQAAGAVLLASATNPAEARAAVAAGVDAVVAQGVEAGGHRGVFDPDASDDELGTLPLTRLLVRELATPVIAAGGIMDGAVVAAALKLGAVAAQLGTAFIGCPESAADAGYRAALFSPAAAHTILTRAISGRPARCLANRFTALGQASPQSAIPSYPIAYDAGKALNAAAKSRGEAGFGAQWAGQGAPLARTLPVAELMRLLEQELTHAMDSAA